MKRMRPGLFDVAPRNTKHISLVVCSPNVTVCGGSFGLLGLAEGADPLAEVDPQIRRWRALDALKRVLLREILSQPQFREIRCAVAHFRFQGVVRSGRCVFADRFDK